MCLLAFIFQVSSFQDQSSTWNTACSSKWRRQHVWLHALACLLPREMERIPEALREVQIFRKSQRKTYTLEDVKGQHNGRVQHFLNIPLHGLLWCDKITRIEGLVTVFLLYCYFLVKPWWTEIDTCLFRNRREARYFIVFLVTRNREVNGEVTVTLRPSSSQKFSRYKQAGGGAFIPATLLVKGPQRYKEFVLERIRCTLPECKNVEEMHFEYLK